MIKKDAYVVISKGKPAQKRREEESGLLFMPLLMRSQNLQKKETLNTDIMPTCLKTQRKNTGASSIETMFPPGSVVFYAFLL
jgi:hypothetical protein